MASVALQRPDKFRIGRVLGDSFTVIGRNPVLCLGLGLVVYALPNFAFSLWFWESVTLVEHGSPEPSVQRIMLSAIGVVGYVLLLSFLQSALMRAAIEDLNGKRPLIRDCIGTALAFLLPAIGISFLLALGVLFGFVLLVVPGLLLLARWFVAIPVLIQERRGVLGSLARSRDLTAGSRWPVVAVWLVVFLATLAINLSLKRLLFAFGSPSGFFVSTILAAAEFVVGSVVPAVSYVELRRVKEGTSVEELAEIFS
ncbi:hypothetical protein [Mesorhizobium sp. B1-1-8]|uniref:hypothetical protein n=1 Tax=Mesorhizobium sp. B1-1-8 TaxID=2589976 RepID=UPI0011299289|nr:hypothetical protein [Mesorhizobium sp. B1-1-8]UCI06026.1 hypothetical protein FJ974_19635 [Mesorhizobium sp. B1-1-8]